MQDLYQAPVKPCSISERNAFWVKVVADQSVSGMSLKKFCQLHQLKYSTFKGYKYRVRSTKNIPSGISKNIQSNIDKFIPLQITSNIPIKDDLKKESIDNTMTEIKIIFNNGHKIFLPLAASEANLLLLVKMVGGLRC